MQDYKIKATESTPTINLDSRTNSLEFEGVSFAEDAMKFYAPVFDWINNYDQLVSQCKPEQIICNFKFEYLNSASYIIVRDVAERLLEIIQKNKIQFEINWFYLEEDEDMLSMAKEFEYLLDTPINYHLLSAN